MELSMGLRFVMEEEDDERYVFWMERRGRGTLPASHAHRRFEHSCRTPLRQSGYHRA